MKFLAPTLVLLLLARTVLALDGHVLIHDPSTIVRCDDKYYTFGTGGSPLVSDDGWIWRLGTMPGRRGMAPDLIHVGDRYLMYVARNVGAQPRADINLVWSKSLDPNSPNYKWVEAGVVAASDGVEDCNAIDPGLLLDPNDGRLWMVYGSYFGYIRLVELDPGTGQRANPGDTPVNLAVNCEAAILIFHEGWYYLLATHGSCCRGAESGYNIRMGRSRKVTGPYFDHEGIDMIQGGGKLFCGSRGRHIGPGHFGLLDLGDGVQKFSCHYEADLDRGGASVLDIRPLLWRDGWPVAGENLVEGTYQIESARTGTVLELAVEGVPVGGPRPRRAGGPGVGASDGPPPGPGMFAGTGGGPIPPQAVAEVSTNWPAGDVPPRLANYLDQAQQKWTFAAVTNAGGYPGSPCFKITIAGTDRALTATEDGELVAGGQFTGEPSQLWRIDQLTDGTWRIMPKSAANSKEPRALSAIGSSSVTLSKFNPAGQRWL
ncbi:MAG TPA: glycoside hydrolase, partial [Verrucomicrobiales bacterium]|nr:glycoside hydrolase [Verrucomicrobiales bacterium]